MGGPFLDYELASSYLAYPRTHFIRSDLVLLKGVFFVDQNPIATNNSFSHLDWKTPYNKACLPDEDN